jgi:excisionase family DNA binding protein
MKLLTTPQTAAMLGVSRYRVWQFIKSGRLPAELIGRDYFVKERDVAKFKSIKRPHGRPKKGD